ncbi:hypothetical protein ACLQ9J_11780 [Bordetella hinzii]|uniref:hypothetical protein n=1 Tax=Bordetella hinzii TaxID=103855 RepID=UPI0039FC8E11
MARRLNICPACKQKAGVPLMWGYPSDDALDAASKGELILGGDVLFDISLNRQCKQCGHQWSTYRRKESAEPAAPEPSRPNTKSESEQKTSPPNKGAAVTDHPVIGEASSPYGLLKNPEAQRPRNVSIAPAVVLFFVIFYVGGALVPLACSDGWHSHSIGRAGACSHHGGINAFPIFLVFLLAAFIAFKFHGYRMKKAQKSASDQE